MTTPDEKTHFALIVEDSDDIAGIMELTLKYLGITSARASNGRQALELFAEKTPDLLLLDIGLPGMSGWEVLETLKARYPDVHCPVIVLTAFVDPANRLIGKFQAQVFRYFTKPFEVAELAQAVREALDIKG